MRNIITSAHNINILIIDSLEHMCRDEDFIRYEESMESFEALSHGIMQV